MVLITRADLDACPFLYLPRRVLDMLLPDILFSTAGAETEELLRLASPLALPREMPRTSPRLSPDLSLQRAKGIVDIKQVNPSAASSGGRV
jgi:hypothetical protein